MDNDFINFLKNNDSKIMDVEEEKEKRPHLGIVLKINEHNYLVPLTSPKEKHLKMKNNLDFIKIERGELGAINLNNMFPVKKGCYSLIDIEAENSENYKILLRKQLSWCNEEKNENYIYKNATKLYDEITKKNEKSIFWKRCCNFKLLEDKILDFFKE